MSIPHIATREWIRSFNMTLMDAWRAWFVDAQVAGLVLNFAKMMHLFLLFLTLRYVQLSQSQLLILTCFN